MNALDSLATAALLGTERRPPDWPDPEGPIGELIAKLPRDDTGKALLQTAGVLGTCYLAGWQPPIIRNSVIPAHQDNEFHSESSPASQALLSGILRDGPLRLQAEAFQKLAGVKQGIPHRLLPKALEAGRRYAILRPYLLPALGRRGLWLAGQNEAWSYAAGGGLEALDAEIWQHGSLDQRKLYLTALRTRDAGGARELVADTLATEGARERTAIVECLANGLSLDDQDLLEATLTDKSKETRQAALRLLSSLTGSHYMQRMAARLEACLTIEKKLIRGTVITIQPPAVYAPDWRADLIEEVKPKGISMGDRAWWLLQIVRAVPLRWWETRTLLRPAELIEWAKKTDWSDALLQGWAHAQSLQRTPEWAEAFLGTQIPPGSSLNHFDLIANLPLSLREKHFLRLITSGETNQSASVVLDRLIQSIPFDGGMLSAGTADALLTFLKLRVNKGEARHDWQLRATLVELACVIPPSHFETCSKGWEITKDGAQPFAEAIARVGIVLDQRQSLHSLTS